MTHPIVEAVIAKVAETLPGVEPLYDEEAREIVAEVLRLARKPSVAVQDAVYDAVLAVLDHKETTLHAYRAGIDALLKEIEG